MRDWPWVHFTPDEMRCKGSGELVVDRDFMDRLDVLRHEFGHPMIVNSGYRSPEYNEQVSSTGLDGPHTTGKAADIRVYGYRAHRLMRLALKAGFTGIGVKQHGPHAGRFLHLDTIEGDGRHPRPWVWTYR